MGWIRLGGVGNYQAFDKWLDLVYMCAFLWVAVRQWDGPVRDIAVALFAWRMVGFLIFEVTQARWALLAFPNVFEFWFVWIAAQRHWWHEYELTQKRLALWLGICTVLKLIQEWILHVWRPLDQYSAVDLVEDWWNSIFSVF